MVAVLSLALLLQVVGSCIVAWEVWEAHRRWVQKFHPTTPTTGNVTAQLPPLKARFDGLVSRAPDLSLDERVTSLEEAHHQAARNLSGAVLRLEDQVIPSAVQQAASDVERRLEPVIRDTIAYLAGLGERGRWMPWWLGPLLLLLGTLLGGGAALYDVLHR